jgi:hypothetical protein
MALRFKAAAVISALLLAAGTVVTFAPAASAVDDQAMCAYDIPGNFQCAYLDESSGFINTANSPPKSTGYWNVNTVLTNPTWHQISSTTGIGCMYFIGPSDPQIEIAGCDATTHDEWRIAYSSGGEIELQNEAYPGDCLNDHYQVGELNAAPCNKGTDEMWGPY